MKLMKHGNPYQYYQNFWAKWGVLANIALRSKLSKIAPKFFFASVPELVFQNLPYKEAWSKVETTTRRIWGVTGLLFLIFSVGIAVSIV